MSEVLHTCSVKAIRLEGTKVNLGLKWALAKRGTLKVKSDFLECGEWRIPYSKIQEAILLSMPYLWTKSYGLTIRTEDATYQFGLNPSEYWKGSLPFVLKREDAGTYWVAVNIIRMAIYAAIIIYLLWSFTQ
jgi:hypothetical protein